MALIKTINRNGEVLTPRIAEGVIMMENATVVGDVAIGEGTTLWFNAVLRGDVNTITIGKHCNIQDGSVLHTLYQKSTIEIGDYVSVGHNVTIHGAHIRDYALIGMGATLLDDVEVGHRSGWCARAQRNEGRRLRGLGWSAGEVHQESRSRADQRNQPQNRPQLRNVRFVVPRVVQVRYTFRCAGASTPAHLCFSGLKTCCAT